MSAQYAYDAVVVGSGPNGLAAAIAVAQAGRSVLVLEGQERIGGGARSAELTLPGFIHDICSAIHPLAVASPFFATLPLDRFGLEWVHPDAPLAHPLPDGSAVLLERSVAATAAQLGPDRAAYERVMAPMVDDWPRLASFILGPIRLPHHPLALARFGLEAIRSARGFVEQHFIGEWAKGFFAGMAAHSVLPLDLPPSAAFGLVLGLSGHAVGWPFPRGGAQCITDALAAYLRSLGGEIVTGRPVESLAMLPPSRAVLCDVTPRQLLRMAGDTLPGGYRKQLERYRYGPGVFKIDYALDGPVPWQVPECARAGTVHLGGTFAEIASSEWAAWRGVPAEQPYVLIAQQSLFDETRAPAGKQTLWAYCHVPHGCDVDMTERVEAQIERFAPGFRDRILARHTLSPSQLQAYNPNYIGGDISGGAELWSQLFTRPTARVIPYSTPVPGLYLCSSSTPPGGGVHGMCGYFAAQAALHGPLR